MQAVSAQRYVLFCGIAIAGCAVDLLTKRLAFERLGMPGAESHWLVDDVFGFTTSLNEGALFGIGQGQGVFFSALSLVAAVGILYWLFVAGGAGIFCSPWRWPASRRASWETFTIGWGCLA